jgi:hypothetical protein
MNIKLIINQPRWMSKPLDLIELIPITSLSVINIKRKTLPYLISPSSNDQHKSTLEQNRMLVSTLRHLLTRLVPIRCLHPIPPTIPMSPQPPSVIQSSRVTSPTSKCNHHTISSTWDTQSRWMICSSPRCFLTYLQFMPLERSLFYIQWPYITYCFITSITTKHQQIRFSIY